MINRKLLGVLFVATFYLSVPLAAYAGPFKNELSRSRSGQALLDLNPKLLTDEVRQQIRTGAVDIVHFRDKEAQEALNALVRIKSRNPLLVGESGAGKTEVVKRMAQIVVTNELPNTTVFRHELSNAEIVQIHAVAIEKLAKKPSAAALEFTQIIKQIEEDTGRPIVLFIDEIHAIDRDIWDVLMIELDSKENPGIKLIGATTTGHLIKLFEMDPSIRRRFKQVSVAEFTKEQTKEVIETAIKDVVEKRYELELEPEVISTIIDSYGSVFPESARPEGPITMLVDIAVEAHALGAKSVAVSDVYDFITKRTKLPSDPRNIEELNKFIREKEGVLKSIIVGHDKLIEESLSLFRNLLLSGGEVPQTAIYVGSTGIGKTYLAETIGNVLFGGPHRYFRINGPAYGDRSVSLNGLVGARPGTNGFKESTGSLVQWMTDPGRGRYGGVLHIDEIDKMHPETLQDLGMDLFPKGEITEGSGKTRRVRNLLIIGTSNHGIHQIFPDGFGEWSEEEVKKRINSFSQKKLRNLHVEATTADNAYKIPKALAARMKFILANPVDEESAFRILRLMFNERLQLFRSRNGIEIEISDEVVRFISHQTFDKEDGVRDLPDVVDSFLSDVLKITDEKVIKIGIRKQVVENNSTFVLQTSKGLLEISNHRFKKMDQMLSVQEMREIQALIGKVNSEVFGQEELVEKSVNAIRNWRQFPTGKPLNIIVVGPTGNGKTTAAQVIGRKLYGSPKKAQIVPFGEISRPEDSTKVFGANPQYLKADQMGTLEKALIELQDGGVLILDELLSLQNDSQGSKRAIMLKIFNIMDQGFWDSPNTGKRYRFSNIVIFMLGNALEKRYYNVSSDDHRLSIYEELKPESSVKLELLKDGYPEAGLGRANLIVHAKPLLEETRLRIAKATIENKLIDLKKKFPELVVEIADETIKAIAEVFFTDQFDGRAIQNNFDKKFTSLITFAIFEAETTQENSKERVIKVAIVDNRSKKHYHIPGVEESFLVDVSVAEKSGKMSVLSRIREDILERSANPKIDRQEVLKVAHHEIGHALLNDPSLTGSEVRHIAVMPGSRSIASYYLGFTSYTSVHYRSQGLKELESVLVRLVAGRISQEVVGFPADTGWSSDFQKMKELIAKYHVEKGLNDDFMSGRIDKDGNFIGSQKLTQRFESLVNLEIKKAKEKAREFLTQNEELVRYLAEILTESGSMSGEQLKFHVDEFNAKGKDANSCGAILGDD